MALSRKIRRRSSREPRRSGNRAAREVRHRHARRVSSGPVRAGAGGRAWHEVCAAQASARAAPPAMVQSALPRTAPKMTVTPPAATARQPTRLVSPLDPCTTSAHHAGTSRALSIVATPAQQSGHLARHERAAHGCLPSDSRGRRPPERTEHALHNPADHGPHDSGRGVRNNEQAPARPAPSRQGSGELQSRSQYQPANRADLQSALTSASEHASQCISMRTANAFNSAESDVSPGFGNNRHRRC
jgi:hypothetical protein